jgi:hypothetical protein
MYTGHPRVTQEQEIGFLKPKEYHWRAPFFFRKTGIPEKPLFFNPEYSQDIVQEATDQEIIYASSCGIDYWAFGYYGDATMPIYKDFTCSLNAYLKSPYKNEINFCIILDGQTVGVDSAANYHSTTIAPEDVLKDWDNYVKNFIKLAKEPTYQRVMNGRPLFYLFSYERLATRLGDKEKSYVLLQNAISSLRKQSIAAGIGDPYIAFSMGVPLPLLADEYMKNGLMDAMFSYHYRSRGTKEGRPYGKLWSDILDDYLSKCDGLKIIPPLMSGANWEPRVLGMPQVFPPMYYTEPKPGELGKHLTSGLDYVAQHPQTCETHSILMYAWNEHSEGGFLCPTIGNPPDYKPDTHQIDEISQALKNWTSPESRVIDGDVLAKYSFGDRSPILESIAEATNVIVKSMRLPPYAYYVPVTNTIRGKRGFSVKYHVRNSDTDYFEFAITPSGKKSTLIDLKRLDIAINRDSKSPVVDVIVQASVGKGGFKDVGYIHYVSPGKNGWEESGIRFPDAYSHLNGKVTIRFSFRRAIVGEQIIVDDISLYGKIED